jgi:predicted nucleotidyltransferase
MGSAEEATAISFAARLAGACADALSDVSNPSRIRSRDPSSDLLVSALLHGSLTMGDFIPGRSDIDLFLVVARRLEDHELSALTDRVRALSAETPRRVDLRVVTREVAAKPVPAPPMEAGYALLPASPLEVETRVSGEPDLVVELSVVRAHGRALLGLEPRTVIGAVPPAWLDAAGDRQLAAWERLTDDTPHAELMVLTTCRVWRFHAERVHCSKTAAGHWALARDPSLVAVHDALRQRIGEPGVTIEPAAIGRLLALVRRELAAS